MRSYTHILKGAYGSFIKWIDITHLRPDACSIRVHGQLLVVVTYLHCLVFSCTVSRQRNFHYSKAGDDHLRVASASNESIATTDSESARHYQRGTVWCPFCLLRRTCGLCVPFWGKFDRELNAQAYSRFGCGLCWDIYCVSFTCALEKVLVCMVFVTYSRLSWEVFIRTPGVVCVCQCVQGCTSAWGGCNYQRLSNFHRTDILCVLFVRRHRYCKCLKLAHRAAWALLRAYISWLQCVIKSTTTLKSWLLLGFFVRRCWSVCSALALLIRTRIFAKPSCGCWIRNSIDTWLRFVIFFIASFIFSIFDVKNLLVRSSLMIIKQFKCGGEEMKKKGDFWE